MSRARIQDAAVLIGMIVFVTLLLWAMISLGGCVTSSAGDRAGGAFEWLRGLFGMSGSGGGSDSGGDGSILDLVNTKVLLPGIGFWFVAVSVGIFLSIVTPLGNKVLVAGIAGFGATLGLIVAVSLIQSLWWALLIVALGLTVWFGIAMRKRLMQTAVIKAFLNPKMTAKRRLELVAKAEKVLKVPIKNGGASIHFGNKKCKLRRKST